MNSSDSAMIVVIFIHGGDYSSTFEEENFIFPFFEIAVILDFAVEFFPFRPTLCFDQTFIANLHCKPVSIKPLDQLLDQTFIASLSSKSRTCRTMISLRKIVHKT